MDIGRLFRRFFPRFNNETIQPKPQKCAKNAEHGESVIERG